MGEQGPELYFSAKMISVDESNQKRCFVVRFSTVNDNVYVWENESDGFRGGFFYKPDHYREKKSFDPLVPYIGNTIEVNHTKFELIDAPDSTLSEMESDPDKYPQSDLMIISQKLKNHKEELLSDFERIDSEHNQRPLIVKAEEILLSSKYGLTKHEVRTLTRRYCFYRTKRFDYSGLISIL